MTYNIYIYICILHTPVFDIYTVICTCIFIEYIYIYIYIYTCVYIYIHVYVYMHIYSIFEYIYIFIRISMIYVFTFFFGDFGPGLFEWLKLCYDHGIYTCSLGSFDSNSVSCQHSFADMLHILVPFFFEEVFVLC